ncbi:hypothetical protein OG285_17665 [Streptomyces sp. NBC_01471]|uniref:hypothetical protein n=1 Tax=Streptomyces sp. NBC_01471 TaxID=2903879 RepID=UPI0032472DFB
MARLRFQRADWPRPALILTDTPRPNCWKCGGEGGHHHDYGDHTGEYAGTEWEPCPCWDENRRWALLPLPRRRQWGTSRDTNPWAPNGYRDEPPF